MPNYECRHQNHNALQSNAVTSNVWCQHLELRIRVSGELTGTIFRKDITNTDFNNDYTACFCHTRWQFHCRFNLLILYPD